MPRQKKNEKPRLVVDEIKVDASVKKALGKLDKAKWEKKQSGNFFKWEKKGQEFLGVFQELKVTTYKDKKQEIIVAVGKDGSPVLLSGVVIVNNLRDCKPGTVIKIVFLGKKKRYNNFDIFTA